MGRHRALGQPQKDNGGSREDGGKGSPQPELGCRVWDPRPASPSLCLVLQGKYLFEIKRKAKRNTDLDRDLCEPRGSGRPVCPGRGRRRGGALASTPRSPTLQRRKRYCFLLNRQKRRLGPGRMSVTFRRAPCWCSGYFLRLDVVSLSPPFQGLARRSGPRESVVRAVTGMNGVKVAT